MSGMKLIYYGFGGFIGLVCGIVINLIFYMVEKSGTPFAANLVEKYGAFGRYLLELINMLPLFGIALGIIMVKVLFGDQLNGKGRNTDGES